MTSRRQIPWGNVVLLLVLAALLTTAYRILVLQYASNALSEQGHVGQPNYVPGSAISRPNAQYDHRPDHHRALRPLGLQQGGIDDKNLPNEQTHPVPAVQAPPSSQGTPQSNNRRPFSQPLPVDPRPPTKLIRNAPGWSIMENVYMSNGTLYIITNDPSEWPKPVFIINVALPLGHGEESDRMREPTSQTISFITPAEAETRWGDRIWDVEDWTFMINDAPQHLNHYYHFVAETFFGLWMTYSSMDPKIDVRGNTELPAPARILFAHHQDHEWRDYSKFNHWVLHGVFPSLSTESAEDWDGRTSMTSSNSASTPSKAFRFTNLVLADRSSSMRGSICPGKTNRIASEAWEVVKSINSRWWWEPVRRSVLRFAGVDKAVADLPVMWDGMWTEGVDPVADNSAVTTASQKMPVVISYIVRTGPRRSLIAEDHRNLVQALTELCATKGWELNIVHAEKLSREEQVQVAAKTTITLGVHGNGLTHLVWMPTTPLSTVIEIFVPGGFATDYEWTARTLGIRHFAIWNDTAYTHPNAPKVDYPEGFQGDQIPAHGPSIARLIQDRVEGRI
ncbi:hypothetical protein FRB96_008006 [Tulasnella sp. 330]|nr:hypothetical protein FRB96_008006 [Tulasnella sp. 330]KAG8876135.1 hypothetical protein FRB98_007447 [Tulasnella sp. 332]KAG8881295.1 hypothetical protein FRB97_009708 [Tulasnella sp. 331]